MPRKVRQILGAAMLVVFVPAYALFAMSVASHRLAGTSILVQTIFFAIAGLIWVVPAGAIIAWMQRP